MLKMIISIIFTVLLLIVSSPTYAGPQYCYGRYALCAASTCAYTGKEIRTKVVSSTTGQLTGYATYPEAVCTCPIMDGKFQAHGANLGQMQGSCSQPGPGLVWSIYSPMPLPQAMHSYSLSKEDQKPLFKVCAAKKIDPLLTALVFPVR